jgi:phosphoglycerate dehydrogenase-like enzyme
MTEDGERRTRVVVATPLEPELVDRLRAIDDRLDIAFEPALLPPPRYPGDHRGREDFRRSPDDERRWRALLDSAEVLFGIPGDDAAQLAEVVARNRGLRWVQATAAGAGEQIAAAELGEEALRRVTFTSSSGVHAVPLAEFCIFGLLAVARELPRMLEDMAERRWQRQPVCELRGRTLVVLGLGAIGAEVARLGRAFGMRVIGVTRSGRSTSADVEDTVAVERLAEVLPQAQALVITLPSTPATRGLLDAEALGRLPRGATLVNVGRGDVLDEQALVRALRDGRLAGAALDVFASEPLAPDSPLWMLPNVIVSPHTAALSPGENERIVELFAESLRRWLRGEPLRNVVDPVRAY